MERDELSILLLDLYHISSTTESTDGNNSIATSHQTSIDNDNINSSSVSAFSAEEEVIKQRGRKFEQEQIDLLQHPDQNKPIDQPQASFRLHDISNTPRKSFIKTPVKNRLRRDARTSCFKKRLIFKNRRKSISHI